MPRHTEIIYGPAPQVRIIPAPFGISVAFFIALYNVNGLREPAGYAPAVMFSVFTVLFGALYWRGNVRITFGENEITVERLFPSARKINAIPYSAIARIKERKSTLKLILYSPEGKVLLAIPGMAQKISGEFDVADGKKDVLPPEGILRERYRLRRELLARSGAQSS